MAIPKKLRDNFTTEIKNMKGIGMTDDEIIKFLKRHLAFDGWVPITFRELFEHTVDFKSLFSYCWHDGEHRCDTIGIRNVNFKVSDTDTKYWILSYSDDDGDPKIEFSDLDAEIDYVGDGEWNYGLYKRR